jgi:hypothetical protein
VHPCASILPNLPEFQRLELVQQFRGFSAIEFVIACFDAKEEAIVRCSAKFFQIENGMMQQWKSAKP